MCHFLGKRIDLHLNKNSYPFSSTCLFWWCDFLRRDGDRMEMGIALQAKTSLWCLWLCFFFFFSCVESIFILQALPSLLRSLYVICSRDRQCSIFIAPLICVTWGYEELASDLEECTGFEWSFYQRSWPHGIFSFCFCFFPVPILPWLQHYHQQTFIEYYLYTDF